MEIPVNDASDGRLVSFVRLDDAPFEDQNVPRSPDCSIVIVIRDRLVLLGFHHERQQWELPGGTLEAGESAHHAAIRELAEETSITTREVSLVASAQYRFPSNANMYLAAVFALEVHSDPVLVSSDELDSFVWWDPADELFDGQCPLDAEIARRALRST